MTSTEVERATVANPTRLLHYEHPERPREAWCGAPVKGVYTPGKPVECAVCAALWEREI